MYIQQNTDTGRHIPPKKSRKNEAQAEKIKAKSAKDIRQNRVNERLRQQKIGDKKAKMSDNTAKKTGDKKAKMNDNTVPKTGGRKAKNER